MTYALIEDNIVVQLYLPGNPPAGYIAVPDFVQPGYRFDGENFLPPEVEVVNDDIPNEISDRQFFQVLAIEGVITEAEALAAVKVGDLPVAFETFIMSLPEDQRFNARMLLGGATTFERDHPLSDAFGTMYGLDSAGIDKLWVKASKL